MQLWVDKYAPSSKEDLIGNGDVVRKLTEWLGRWNSVHITKQRKIGFTKENPGAKAALLSGPPGIGKSTTAALLAKKGGFEVLELNASDQRSKKSMGEQLQEATQTNAISMSGSINKNRVVIMDEVDGMGGNEDRGGVQELIKLIKTSSVPIICICNDRQHQKIRSLANHCFDLRLRRPVKTQIAKRAVEIARREGMALEYNAAELLAESCGNDIRQVINCLQMWRQKSTSVSFMDMKKGVEGEINKDEILRMTANDGAKNILDPRQTSLNDRLNGFFIDYNLIPLLIQQNYVNALQSSSQIQGDSKVARLSLAAEAMSDCDLVESALRSEQNWSLLPVQAALTVRVGTHARGSCGFPGFPEWFGKNSTTNKKKRLTSELAMHLNSSVSGGLEAVRLSYVPALRDRLMKPMVEQGADAVDATIAAMDEYGLSRDDLFETLKELQFSNQKDIFAGMDTKTKTAFTRKFNQGVHKSQALGGGEVTKKRKRAVDDAPGGMLGDEDEGQESESESDTDEAAAAAFLSKKKAPAKKKAAPKKPGSAPKKKAAKKR